MKERIITLALAAAVSIGMAAPAFAQVSESAAGIVTGNGVVADCMIQKRHCHKRVYKRCAVKRKRVIAKPVEKIVRVETTRVIEKPVVVQQPAPEQPAATPVVEQPVSIQPACLEQPVIIDRFERHHRSLIHLGLFPFSLFGQ